MAGDFSRNTFDPSRHFSGVLMQQGRVLVDAEWNEQLDIQQHRDHTEARDVIGRCGTPKTEEGFLILQTPTGNDLLISPGRYYVDGLLCELDGTQVQVTFPLGGNHQVIVPYLYLDGFDLDKGQWVEIAATQNPVALFARITDIDPKTLTVTVDGDVSSYRNAGVATLRRAVTYTTQPDYPTPKTVLSSPPHSPSGGSPVNLSDGDYLVYLVAWQQEVNALEDPRIREVALGGPDTTERRRTVWQVRLLPVSSTGTHLSPPITSPPTALARCCDDFPEWGKLIAPSTGMMNAQTVPPKGDKNPCVLPPTAGFQRLENQLYRVEVFRGGDTRDKSTFVWSRDNASFQTSIVKVDGADIYVTSLGKDDYFSFAAGQWVEIAFPESELSGASRFLTQITAPPDTSGPNPRLRLSATPPAFTASDLAQLRLIRWDMTETTVTPNGIPMTAGWIDIDPGSGIQVQFSEGAYKTGDYWEIPARTRTGDIEWPPFQVPNPNPVPQSPLGIKRHYCCLAHLSVSGGIWMPIHDCRSKFPALTHICADDVCYRGTCDLPGIVTVQDAIDQLCQQRDLRFHNRHLHGWGIVCGLKVTCGPDDLGKLRRHVTVSSGYAIDCLGNDVILNQDQTLDVMSMVEKLPAPPLTSPPGLNFPNGDYSLILDSAVPGNFRIEEFVAKNFWDSVLNDTLLLDIYNDCIKNIISTLQELLSTTGSTNDPVGPGLRLVTSLTNLLASYNNADVGNYVFLSGDSNQNVETADHEDKILRDFYNLLRNLFQSHTYCGMFDHLRQFPGTPNASVKYPYTGLKITTIFGKDNRARLRVDPTGARGYAMGADAVIHVYDLNTQTLAAVVPFVDTAAGVVVQDVAFSSDGKPIYAVASLNNQHTMVAMGTLSDTQIQWQNQTVISNLVFVTLGTFSKAAGKIFALAIGKGLYEFDTQTVFTNPTVPQLSAFNAFVHMSIDDAARLMVASALTPPASPQVPDHFDQVLLFDLNKIGTPPIYHLTGQGTVDDDISIFESTAPAGNAPPTRVAIISKTPSQTNRQLLILDLIQFRQQATVAPIDTGESGGVKLAYNQTTNFLMLAMKNNFRIQLADPLKLTLAPNVFPAQIQPAGIAAIAKTNAVYVLNFFSNTLTAYSADLLAPPKALQLQPLVNYRVAAIDAFLDLIGGFLEYLKDCICEHLLVECPTCDQDDQLFLGVVSIRENQVFKICNFAGRKYVKSFPTVGYWLSAIPIIPIIGKLIEMACCAELPNLFGKLSAPQPSANVTTNPATGSGANSKMNLQAVGGAIHLFRQTSFQNLMQTAMKKVAPTQTFLTDFLANKAKTFAPAPSQPAVHGSQLVGTPVDVATGRLQSAGVQVANVVRYDPSALGQNLAGFTTAPESVPSGETVSLVVNDQNQVVYYKRSSADVAALQTQVQASQHQIKQTADAVDQVSALSQQLKASVDATQQTLSASQPALAAAAALQNRVSNLETLTSTHQAALDTTNNLQTMVANLTAQLATQQAAHDQALAIRDKQIADLSTQTKTLQTQLQQFSTRLPGGTGGLPK
jgi:hypothetical protein